MVYFIAGAALLFVLRTVRKARKTRAAKADRLTGWLADYSPDAPSHLRDPEDGTVQRGRL